MKVKSMDSTAPTNPKLKKLWDKFYDSYKALRAEFLKQEPGGAMDMLLKIRDKGAEERFQRRQAGWQKRKANRAQSQRLHRKFGMKG